MIDPEIGFTSNVIKNPNRFVGRQRLFRNCIKAINAPLSLIAVHGKRGVGKSSLARQIQQIAVGNYSIIKNSGLEFEIPEFPRKYLTVYYQCDSMIKDVEGLLTRILNDQHEEDGLLRLVPDEGKQIVEFERVTEINGGIDLKVVNWGATGVHSSKYAKIVQNDIVQTFRNYVNAIITHQVKKKMKRHGLLIILDEFDVIQNKAGIGSLIKSLSSETVKFVICGIGNELFELIADHGSIERLLEEGSLHIEPMSVTESAKIIKRAEKLFQNKMSFEESVIDEIAKMSQGYPYLVQLIGKECVIKANELNVNIVTDKVFKFVKDDIQYGRAFPTLERHYKKAAGISNDRKRLLYILASQEEDPKTFDTELGKLALKKVRKDAEELGMKNIDQLLPRLITSKYGTPVLKKVPDMPGYYEFVNPIFRVYCQLRDLS